MEIYKKSLLIRLALKLNIDRNSIRKCKSIEELKRLIRNKINNIADINGISYDDELENLKRLAKRLGLKTDIDCNDSKYIINCITLYLKELIQKNINLENHFKKLELQIEITSLSDLKIDYKESPFKNRV